MKESLQWTHADRRGAEKEKTTCQESLSCVHKPAKAYQWICLSQLSEASSFVKWNFRTVLMMGHLGRARAAMGVVLVPDGANLRLLSTWNRKKRRHRRHGKSSKLSGRWELSKKGRTRHSLVNVRQSHFSHSGLRRCPRLPRRGVMGRWRPSPRRRGWRHHGIRWGLAPPRFFALWMRHETDSGGSNQVSFGMATALTPTKSRWLHCTSGIVLMQVPDTVNLYLPHICCFEMVDFFLPKQWDRTSSVPAILFCLLPLLPVIRLLVKIYRKGGRG